MTLGQIDPARLQGEGLRRWYSRTPAEIEAERAAAAKQAYGAFFSQSGGKALRDPSARPVTAPSTDLAGLQIQVAAPARGFWNYWSPQGCASCHGYTPGTLPPLGGQLPLPPTYSPRSGGASGGQGGSRPHRGDKEECHQQYASDSQICGNLRSPSDIAICRDTASKRYANCLPIDGRLNFPSLETRGGRRP